MNNSNERDKYYLENQLGSNQMKNSNNLVPNNVLTTKSYVKRLITLQVLSMFIILVSGVLQAVAVGTNDWYVLNVNEYIPTSKGGLWFYCYIASTGFFGQFNCLRYEELPNFAVFLNSRLYDSRILLICSCGFCFLLTFIEIFGIVCLSVAENKGDLFDRLVARSSSRLRIDAISSDSILSSPSQGKAKVKNKQKSSRIGFNDEISNSARFTTSIIVNPDQNDCTETQTIKPTGYFAYLAIALINLVGSVMDFVLKVSGFALFDSYMNNLLSFNTVFLAYRSYSYWLMIISICLLFFFWIFKVFSTRYVINLTKRLIESREKFASGYESVQNSQNQSHSQLNPFNTNYTTITRIKDEVNENAEKPNAEKSTAQRVMPTKPSFVYDLDSNEDDLSSSSYTSKNQSEALDSNYIKDYVQNNSLSNKDADTVSKHSLESGSIIRF